MKNKALIILVCSLSAYAMDLSIQEQIKKQQNLNRDLGIAAQTGELGDTIRLIEEGADPIAPSIEGGSTPLLKAAHYGHLDVVTYLVGICGANINELDKTFGISPFHAACISGHLGVVEFLARNGADIHLLDKKGNNAYYLAQKYANDSIAKFIYKFDEETFQDNKTKN